MAVVAFDIAEFREIYPQFAADKVTDAQLEWAFAVAAEFVGNTDRSPAPYDPGRAVETRKILLYLLTCHLVTLALRAVSGQSGAATSVAASTSSLSMSFQIPSGSSDDYYAQTPCGQDFWEMWKKRKYGGRYFAYRRCHPWG